MSDASRSIVIVDDDEDIVALLEALIGTRAEYRLAGVYADGDTGSAAVLGGGVRPDALVVGAQRGTFDAIEMIRALREELPDACIVLLADVADPLTLLDALAGGASTVLSSGWGWAELMPALDVLLDRRAA